MSFMQNFKHTHPQQCPRGTGVQINTGLCVESTRGDSVKGRALWEREAGGGGDRGESSKLQKPKLHDVIATLRQQLRTVMVTGTSQAQEAQEGAEGRGKRPMAGETGPGNVSPASPKKKRRQKLRTHVLK